MNHLNPAKKEPSSQVSEQPGAVFNIIPHLNDNNSTKNEIYIAHLAAVVESSDEAIISKSIDGTITSWNKGSEKMFGYAAEEAVGKPITMLFPLAFLNEEKTILEKIRNNEIIDHFETVRIKKNGIEFYVSLTVSPLKDRAGAIIGASKIARDISARKNSEAELIRLNRELEFQNTEKEKRTAELLIANKELLFRNEENERRASELSLANKELIIQNAEKAKCAAELVMANIKLEQEIKEKEIRTTALITTIANLKHSKQQIIDANNELESFSYSVSHDLRAPLRAINFYTQMLEANFGNQLDPEANRLMSNIVRNAHKMSQLIDDMIAFSRVARRALVKSIVPMEEIVTDICNRFKHDQGNRNLLFHVSHILPALADNMAIKQVWLNLISNAVKYTQRKEAGVIEISSEITGNKITYSIKDNGAGFDMRYAKKLFGLFQRMHSDEEFEGTGVGLAVASRIISKHGGRIWAEAKVDEGATFHFTLNRS